jgi:[NiFe] hydrogenase assembly HybE family chaperone
MTASALPHIARTLEAGFRHIASTRMAGVPVLNPALRVQAVGLLPDAEDTAVAFGVLVTPWFMNLLRVPLNDEAGAAMLGVGVKAERDCGARRFEFIGAHEAAVGRYESASLFSPMFEFADQAAAVATAHEVLALLRPPAAASPARRGFLFGRGAVAAAR